MEVKESDIKTAVEILADTSSDVLNIIISAREGQLEHVDSYLYMAARAKKLKIVSCLLELGADPSAISFELVTHALKKKDESTAKQLWQIMKPGFDPSKVNICTLIATSLADYPEFVSELLNVGVNPNGSGKKKPLLEVIGLSYLSPAKRNHLISILLEKGADCNQLCLASKSATTPLHIVTNFALEAGGDTSVIDALVASPTFEYEKRSLPQKLEIHVKKLLSTADTAYFKHIPIVEEKEDKQVHHMSKSRDCSLNSTTQELESQSQDGMDHNILFPHGTVKKRQATPSTTSGSKVEDVAEAANISELFSQYGFHNFDKLPWEVEVTNRVKKFLKDERNNSKALRVSVVRTIFQLAEGQRGTHLAKAVSGVPSLHLYRAKMNKGGRILWEKAIQFSPRQTHSHKAPIYSQVIRIWDVVPNHDHLARCIKQVESSFERGNSAAINFSLLPQETNKCEPVRSREQLDIPKTFLLQSDLVLPARQQFIPAASMKKDEYNVTYFYSFSSAMVKSVLIGGEHRRDFPFKEWPKEHEIINLQIKESILLLGRSGTGKTTCCLYRLWNEFKLYWDPEVRHPDSKLPRETLISGGAMEDLMVECPEEYEEKVEEKEEEEEKEDDDKCTKFATGGSTSSLPITHSCSTISCSPGVDDKGFPLFEDVHVYGEDESSKHAQQSEASSASEQQTDAQEFPLVCGADEVLENLHQVFITKNYVLCAQVKRRFFDMAAAHDFLKNHLKFEKEDIPSHLSRVDDLAYPLFLTARQFYILLDNSLEDGKNFFPRADDGTLKVKIISRDYDHEDVDTLFDLEQSNGDEDLGKEPVAQRIQPKLATSKSVPAKWTEVTSLYFKECVWPAIAHKCGKEARSFDPLLVWTEIQSFIKGSEAALRKGSPLTIDEYQVVGNRMAPNFADQRKCIYKAFLHYEEYCQNQRHRVRLFDECDIVQQLYHRLCQLKDVCWSIHCFFIDEVQDFTQAELALFLHCCRDPNSNFFTGDTAQSIMRGIAFRFQDLRSLFYRIHRKVPQVRVPHKPFTLTINFRSHSGILKMAGSVIDLLTGFFHGSIDDNLPEDKGMFPGPTPVLIESCEVSDLALLLRSKKRESSAIEFGCHQIILVQSKEAKEKLPDILQGAIVLTIFEAKGLEFDDVLLYNFFTDSLVDEKSWKVVTSYLQQNPTCVGNDAKVPGTTKEPHSLKFDEKQHKSLSAELKYLYTAITRAKCNLWIYDSHKERRLPMFNYWYKRNLVKVVGAEGLMEGEHSIIFTSISTEDQWKVQGDNFKKKHLWEQARHCYLKSGEEYAYLALEAKARILIQQARQQGHRQCYLEAAVCFFECDNSHHNVNYLKSAALCLKKTQPPKYSEAAKLFERLGERTKAFEAFKHASDAKNCSRLKEEDSEFTESIRILDYFNEKLEALAKSEYFEKKGYKIEPDMSVKALSYEYAKRYAASKEEQMLCDVLEYVSDLSRKARFYKEGGIFEKAFEIYKSQKQFNEAFRLATAQMAANYAASTSDFFSSEQKSANARKANLWKDRAKFVADEKKDKKMKASYVLQALKLKFGDITGSRTFFESDEGKELRRVCKSYKDQDIQAQANLLMCRLSKDGDICRTYKGVCERLRHRIGELEAFDVLVQLNVKESLRTVLDMCHLAAETRELLAEPRNAYAEKVTQQALVFFNLQRVGNEYVIPQGQEAWLGELLCEMVKQKATDKKQHLDVDGMLRLERAAVRRALEKHYLSYGKKWFKHIEVLARQQLQQPFSSHIDVDAKYSLSRVYSSSEVMQMKLTDYICNCILDYEMSDIRNRCGHGADHETEAHLQRILTIFSPQVSLFFPLRKDHVMVVRKSRQMKDLLHKWIRGMLKEAKKRDRESFDVNLWLLLWRACCLSDGNVTVIDKSLSWHTQSVNKKFYEKKNESAESPTESTLFGSQSEPASSESGRYQPSSAFLFLENEEMYCHRFSCWLQSCTSMKEGAVLYSAQCVVMYFLSTIEGTNISITNLVEIFALHCTSLLAILTHINAIRAFKTHFWVPFLYKRIVQLFDDLNDTSKFKGKSVLVACTEQVFAKQGIHQQLIGDCQKVLRTMLDILLDYYARFHFPVDVLEQKDLLRNSAACHCLILTLTIFGNLMLVESMYPVRSRLNWMGERLHKLRHILYKIQISQSAPSFISEALQALQSDEFHSKIFPLITNLLQRFDRHGRLVYLQLKVIPNNPPRVCFIDHESDKFRPQTHASSQKQPPPHASPNITYSPTFPDPLSKPRMFGTVPYSVSVPVHTSPSSAPQPHIMPHTSHSSPLPATPIEVQNNPQPSQVSFQQMTRLTVIPKPPISPTGSDSQQLGDHSTDYFHPSGQPGEVVIEDAPYSLEQVASGPGTSMSSSFPEVELSEKEIPEHDEDGVHADNDIEDPLSELHAHDLQHSGDKPVSDGATDKPLRSAEGKKQSREKKRRTRNK